jgi:hypothetical protein
MPPAPAAFAQVARTDSTSASSADWRYAELRSAIADHRFRASLVGEFWVSDSEPCSKSTSGTDQISRPALLGRMKTEPVE